MRLGFFILTILTVVCTHTAHAQYKQLVKDGNKLYQQKKYKEASDAYLRALQKNPTYTPGAFNLGNALYQQKQYDGTRKVMEQVTKMDTSRKGTAAANYNIGNSYMAEQKWEEAIDAYKKALRANPQDDDAKYNLSYAQQMLKKNGGGGGKNNKDNKDNKDDKNKDNKDNKDDKNKDRQNKDNKDNKDDKNKDNKDQQDQNKDNKDDKKDEQDKRPQPQQSKMSEKQAEQLLNALQQEEKKLQDKHKKAAGTPVKVEKDW